VKPRYMIPVAPILFVLLWLGMSVALRWLAARRATGVERQAALAKASRWSLGTLVVVSVLLNGFAYAVEFYVHRVGAKPGYDFYDIARRGGYSDLVDICSYLRKNAPHDVLIYLNRGKDRRIVHLMANRDVTTIRRREVPVRDASDAAGLAAFFGRVPGRYAIALFDEPLWPRFHWPLTRQAPPPEKPPRWWQLFELDEKTKQWRAVKVPRDRSAIDNLLVTGIGGRAE
jgi:hypothetical protein